MNEISKQMDGRVDRNDEKEEQFFPDIKRIGESFSKCNGVVMHMFIDGKTYGVGIYIDKDADWKTSKRLLECLGKSCWYEWMKQKYGDEPKKWPSALENRGTE